MSQREIQWNIRHILKDGRLLGPGEKLPITEASLEAFRQYGEIALKAAAQMRDREAVSIGCSDVTVRRQENKCPNYARKRAQTSSILHDTRPQSSTSA